MKILALEFSSPRRSVAVVVDGQLRARVEEADPRANRALSWIEAALRAAGLEREKVECLAIGIGPGSYTGIRSAIALAQGWQLARGTHILGISSVECLAAQAQAERIHGRINIVIDAQRNEFYLARFEAGPSGARLLSPLHLAGRQTVLELISAGEIVLGPEAATWFPGARAVFPDAAMLGQLAAQRDDFLPGEKLEPVYLREASFAKAKPPRVIPAV